MKRIFKIFTALTKDWLRSKQGVFFSILFPVMLLLIFSAVFGGQGTPEYSLHVQNNDITQNGNPTQLSQDFVGALNSTQALNIKKIDTETNITNWINKDQSYTKSKRVLVIPKGFKNQSIQKSKEVRITIIQDTVQRMQEQFKEEMNETEESSINQGKEQLKEAKDRIGSNASSNITLLYNEADQSSSIIRGIINNVKSEFNAKLLGAEEGIIKFNTNSFTNQGTSAEEYYLPAILAAFIMTNGIIGVTSSISEHKRSGVLKRMAATPLRKRDWIIGNILQQALQAFMLTGIMILLSRLLFGVEALPGPLAILLILLGSIAFCSIGITLGGIIKDVEAASGLGNAIAFPMMFLSGAFFTLEIMPEYLQTIAKLLPLYYFHNGLRELMIYNNPQNSITAFGILGIIAMTFIILSIHVTKWKELN